MSVKFGVRIDQADLTYEEIRHLFIKLEKLGFNSAFLTDHFQPIITPENSPFLENWVSLSALAAETSKIRVGTNVNCNSYRHPGMLAKMAASLDVISGGRLEFMIGAGWYEPEYKGYGIPFPPAKIRIEKMKEAIQVIKILWTEHKPYFKGKHYRLEGALNYPKPLQKPYPRIWVGGGGEKYTLKVIAEVGEGTNLGGPPEVIERKLNILRKYCEEVNRDCASIAHSWSGYMITGKDNGEIRNEIEKLEAVYVKLRGIGIIKEMPRSEDIKKQGLIGTPSEVIDKIEKYQKLGVEHFITVPPDLKNMKMMKLFAEEIIPGFR